MQTRPAKFLKILLFCAALSPSFPSLSTGITPSSDEGPYQLVPLPNPELRE
jgi:hypothetical protein